MLLNYFVGLQSMIFTSKMPSIRCYLSVRPTKILWSTKIHVIYLPLFKSVIYLTFIDYGPQYHNICMIFFISFSIFSKNINKFYSLHAIGLCDLGVCAAMLLKQYCRWSDIVAQVKQGQQNTQRWQSCWNGESYFTFK